MNRQGPVLGRPLTAPAVEEAPARAQATPRGAADEGESARLDTTGVPAVAVLRDWADALVVAIVIALFLRVFILELYQIPSGSMTPTLIGGEILRTDYNGDNLLDLLLLREDGPPLLFLNDGVGLTGQGEAADIDPLELNRLRRQRKTSLIYDRILVNKLAFWLHAPRRGDIIVFKTPERIWDPLKPIYIKRCVGEPGDVLGFDEPGHLLVGGLPATKPAFFLRQRYAYMLDAPVERERPEIEYARTEDYRPILKRIHVPRGEVYVFGDNTWSSYDSRIWGGVPLNNIRGRAFFCYWPPERMQTFKSE